MAGERKFVTEKIRRVLLKEYFMKEVKKAGFGGIDIQRTPMGTRVTLLTERPGLVIGRRGATIKMLTEAVEFKFKFDKPQIEVVEVKNPNLNAQIMAEKLASALERGWHFRRAGHSTVRRIMGAKARGCQIIISGKLTGNRHRMEKFKEGHIKFCGDPKLKFMEEGFSVAKLKAGVIGVKVQIMNPDAKLPDEITVKKPAEVLAEAEAKKELAREAKETKADDPEPKKAGPKTDKKAKKADKKEKKPAKPKADAIPGEKKNKPEDKPEAKPEPKKEPAAEKPAPATKAPVEAKEQEPKEPESRKEEAGSETSKEPEVKKIEAKPAEAPKVAPSKEDEKSKEEVDGTA